MGGRPENQTGPPDEAIGSGEVLVRVLGPSTVELDGAPIPITAIQRRIVCRLALSAPHPVTFDGLADAVWGERAPATARASLANQVSRIRNAVLGPLIATAPDGYRLDAATDAAAVLALVEDAERAFAAENADRAFAAADGALRQWRGRPYDELGNLEAVLPTRELLAERRVATETLRLAAAVECKRAGWAVAEGERLVAERPLDEQRWTLLVQALDLDGRRGDALATVDRARRALRDGAGLDLGSRLRDVAGTITDADRAAPPPLPTNVVGREAELAQLVDAGIEGRRLTVRGEAGAGRSAVLSELVRRLRHRDGLDGVGVAWARCPTDPATPVEVLHTLLQDLGIEPERRSGPVADFVHAVGHAGEARPLVLVVDDLHRAGPSTRAALDAAAELAGVALIVSVDGHPGDGDDGATVDLSPLTRNDVAIVAAEMPGSGSELTATAVDWLMEMSGGNPLILRLLVDGHDWPLARRGPDENDVTALATPGSPALRSLARRRLDGLDAAAVAAVEAASVFGTEARADLLVALTDRRGLTAAVADGVLVDHGEHVRFRHGALRRTLYDDLASGRRVELHYAVGTALRATGAPAAPVAEHLLLAGELDPIAALDAARLAVAAATANGALSEAVRWFAHSEPLARALGTDGLRQLAQVLVGWIDARRRAGDLVHERILLEAVDLASRLGDPELTGEVDQLLSEG